MRLMSRSAFVRGLVVVGTLLMAACRNDTAPNASGMTGDGSIPCQTDSACPDGQRCMSGVCGVAECASNADCASGETCDISLATCIPATSGSTTGGSTAPSATSVSVLDLQQVPPTAKHPASGTLVELTRVVASSAVLTLDGGPALFVEDAPLFAGGSANAYSAILVSLAGAATVSPGDALTITGTYAVKGGVGIITGAKVTTSSSDSAPAPATLAASDLASLGRWEGALVTLSGGTASAVNSGGFTLGEGSTHVLVDDRLFNSRPAVANGDALDSVTGFIHVENGASVLLPRSAGDVVKAAVQNPGGTGSGTGGTTSGGLTNSNGGTTAGARAPAAGELEINEFLADPPSSTSDPTVGDANGDGHRDGAEDEFVEVVNRTSVPLALDGLRLRTLDKSHRPAVMTDRAAFPAGTTLAPGKAAVVFGGGSPAGSFGGSLVFALQNDCSTSPCLSLSNAGSTIELADAAGTVIDTVTYDSTLGGKPQSGNRGPDVTGSAFVAHKSLNPQKAYSPGTHADGTGF